MRAVVQIPAYHEGPQLAETAEAILQQRAPDGVAVDVEAWVTPDPDPSSCSTWAAAEAVSGLDVYEAPIGKLSARNAAHSHAVTAGYDAFVTWDADAVPLHDQVLVELLAPLMESEQYPAVNSTPVTDPDGDGGLLAQVVDSAARAEDILAPHLNGQAHAIRTAAWEQAGPFDTDRDETSLWETRQEEEYGMWGRLRRLGPIPRPNEATVFNDPRRHICKIPGAASPDWCDAVNMTDTHERE
jgi:hypothetical protein